MYPVCSCVIEKSRDGTCYARRIGEREGQKIPRWFAQFLWQLDGKTDPLTIQPRFSPEQLRELMPMLEELGYVRTSRWSFSLFSTECTLWFAPRRISAALRRMCRTASLLLMLLWLPMLVFGLWRFLAQNSAAGGSGILGMILGTVLGLTLHEAAHAVSCIGCRGYLSSVGLMTQLIVLPFAFAELDSVRLSRSARIRILLAGVEMNFLLAGAGLSMTTVSLGTFWAAFGLSNLLLALLNSGIYYVGLDGARVLSELLGTDLEVSAEILTERSVRQMVRARLGAAGGARIAVTRLLSLMQMGIMVVLLLNIREVISWFS